MGRATKFRTKGCLRYWRPKFATRQGSSAAKPVSVLLGSQRMSVNTLLWAIFAAQLLPSPRGQFWNWQKNKSPLLWGRGTLGGIEETIWVRAIAGQKLPRQWGVNFCCEASRCLAGPSGWVWRRFAMTQKSLALVLGPHPPAITGISGLQPKRRKINKEIAVSASPGKFVKSEK